MTRIKHIKRIVIPNKHKKRSSLLSSLLYIPSFGFSEVPERWPRKHRGFFMQRKQDPQRVRDINAQEQYTSSSGTYTSPPEPGLGFFHITLPPASLQSTTYQQKFWSQTWHQLGYWSHWQVELWTPSGARSWFEHCGYNNTGTFHLYKTKYSTTSTFSHSVLPSPAITAVL